jgi:hypothetical protein
MAFSGYLWICYTLMPRTLLRRNWDDASLTETSVALGKVALVFILGIAVWKAGEVLGIAVLRRLVPRQTLRSVFVRGGAISPWEARVFDALCSENL